MSVIKIKCLNLLGIVCKLKVTIGKKILTASKVIIIKDYFCIVFGSVLICIKILKDRNSGVPVCGDFLTCNILLVVTI